MAKQIEGVAERILTAARQEFLDKGYVDASLRTIAAAADTSTNSIYVRFGDKEGLFSAIVEPVLSTMIERFIRIQERFHQMAPAEQAERMPKYADGGTAELVHYMYAHLDEFRLLLDFSYGTRFHNFVDELVRIEVEYTDKYIEAVGYPRTYGGEAAAYRDDLPVRGNLRGDPPRNEPGGGSRVYRAAEPVSSQWVFEDFWDGQRRCVTTVEQAVGSGSLSISMAVSCR